MNNRLRYFTILLAMAAMFATAGSAWAAQGSGKTTPDEFFILSSVNLPKHSLVLKLPTEVTMQMKLTEKTVIVDENGKRLHPSDLRAGDTAYITYTRGPEGTSAVKIRLGPMTVQELRRRYLNGLPVTVPRPAAPRILPHPTKNVQRGQRR